MREKNRKASVFMFVLVTGGSASGKSEYAENRLMELREQRTHSVYIATMQPFGSEAQERIKKHKEQRKQKSFDTVECYTDLQAVNMLSGNDILLECMSNLVANEMFRDSGVLTKGEILCKKILTGVDCLLAQCRNLVIVTNEIFSDTMNYEKETLEYIKLLGMVNCELARKADEVVEVVYGIPLIRKKNI